MVEKLASHKHTNLLGLFVGNEENEELWMRSLKPILWSWLLNEVDQSRRVSNQWRASASEKNQTVSREILPQSIYFNGTIPNISLYYLLMSVKNLFSPH